MGGMLLRLVCSRTAIFAIVPDLTATILRTATSGAEIWSEWKMRGTDAAGAHVTLVGPVVLTTRNGRIAWTRFYLDRVGAAAG